MTDQAMLLTDLVSNFKADASEAFETQSVMQAQSEEEIEPELLRAA